MGATTFVPLKAELIDEGEFLQNVDAELEELQKKLIEFVTLHEHKALKAEASLTITIKLKAANIDDEIYTIATQMKSSVPKRPMSMSVAMGGEDQAGKLTLLVRQEGSDETRPEQGKLFPTKGKED